MNGDQKKNLALIGFMGVGKTTVGKTCAQKLGFAYVDTDDLIAEREGMSIASLFQARGEMAFRELESRVIEEISHKSRVVIATGGGAILERRNVENLSKTCFIVHLTAPPEAILRRIGNPASRPLLASEESPLDKIKSLSETRKSHYREAANVTISAVRANETVELLSSSGADEDRTPEEIADEIVALFRNSGKDL